MHPASVALLRGVNVGGRNTLPMKDLVHFFEAAGCEDVRTYIASGNVVFRAPADIVPGLPDRIASAVRERFGHAPLAIVRSGAEMQATIRLNPYSRAAEAQALHVMFLADFPIPERTRALDPERSPGDAYAIVGRELYFALGTSMATTKLTTAYFDKALATTSTIRNWRTVLALTAMLAP